jgi:hypothetical protein
MFTIFTCLMTQTPSNEYPQPTAGNTDLNRRHAAAAQPCHTASVHRNLHTTTPSIPAAAIRTPRLFPISELHRSFAFVALHLLIRRLLKVLLPLFKTVQS